MAGAEVGALVGGVKVRTRPGFFPGVGLPPGDGPVPPDPARILASRSATEGPVDVPAALGGAGVGTAFESGAVGMVGVTGAKRSEERRGAASRP